MTPQYQTIVTLEGDDANFIIDFIEDTQFDIALQYLLTFDSDEKLSLSPTEVKPWEKSDTIHRIDNFILSVNEPLLKVSLIRKF